MLLCSNQSLTGPGQIYRLHFVASTTPQITEVRFDPGLQFYDDGLFVNPAHPSNALIGIGMSPVGVGADATEAGTVLVWLRGGVVRPYCLCPSCIRRGEQGERAAVLAAVERRLSQQ